MTRSSWTSIGPTNVGGRVRALAVHPTTPSTIFAGGTNGGIWRSTDSGATWQKIDDYLPSLAITTIVFQPGSPSTMYAGTGEAFNQVDGARGVGILKSTDGGSTWSLLSSTSTPDFDYVNKLAMSADGSILLAATNTGVFRSTDGGGSFTLGLTATGAGYTEFADVKFFAGSSTEAIASGNSENAYRSTNGGATWTAATGLVLQTTNATARFSTQLGIGGSGSNVVYLSMKTLAGGEVWKSTDRGASYAKVSAAGQPGHLWNFGNAANAVWVDPTNDSTVVVGGGDLFRSTDGGVNWTAISAKDFFLEGLSIHGFQHIIVSDPNYNGSTNRRVYIANDGGVWKAEDILQTPHATTHPCCNTIDFVSLNAGLVLTNFYGAAGDPATGTIVGGTQSNGTIVYKTANGAGGWTAMAGDDAGSAGIDTTDNNYMYGSLAYIRLYRSTNGGTSASAIYGSNSTGTCKAAPYRIDDACNATANYTAPFLLDPNNPDRLLAGGISLWRSDDVKAALTETTGPHWTAIKGSSGGSYINAITIASGNSDVVWVGHSNGDVYRTASGTSGSPSWTQVDGSTLPDRAVNVIAVDSRNTSVVYVGFDGYNSDNLWKTMDNGSTWNALSNLPAVPVRSIAVDSRGSEFLYVGTGAGMFTSNSGGVSWDSATVGPANTDVRQLFWMGSTLVASTHGRGMFTTSIPSPVNASPSSLSFSAMRNPGEPVILALTPPRSVTLGYTGATPPAWSASADQAWISASVDAGGVVTIGIANPGNVIGSSTALAGHVTIAASNVGTAVTIPISLSVLTNGPSDPVMALDSPANGGSAPRNRIQVSGWALDRGSAVLSGIDQVHVWLFPIVDGALGSPTFLGLATRNLWRPDVGAVFGSQFSSAGFYLRGAVATNGTYRVVVYAHDALTGSFVMSRSADFRTTDPTTDPAMYIDTPANGASVGLSFTIGGWAADIGAETGSGVDMVHVWAFPKVGGSFGSGTFLGAASYGGPRADVAAVFGSQFTNSGYNLTVNNLPLGDYRIIVYARSTLTGTFNQSRSIDVSVGSLPAMYIDTPVYGSSPVQPLAVSGWAIDRAALSGAGVDQVHVYAFPVGGGSPKFVGAAAVGMPRADVGAVYGSQFNNSGFSLTGVGGLSSAQYDIVVFAHSTVTGTFNQQRSVRISVQ